MGTSSLWRARWSAMRLHVLSDWPRVFAGRSTSMGRGKIAAKRRLLARPLYRQSTKTILSSSVTRPRPCRRGNPCWQRVEWLLLGVILPSAIVAICWGWLGLVAATRAWSPHRHRGCPSWPSFPTSTAKALPCNPHLFIVAAAAIGKHHDVNQLVLHLALPTVCVSLSARQYPPIVARQTPARQRHYCYRAHCH